jgi:hypothetical protein
MEVERERVSILLSGVENTDQKSYSLKDLYQSTLGTKMIPELSNYLIIEAWVVQFHFKPGSRGYLDVCSIHDGLLPARERWWNP